MGVRRRDFLAGLGTGALTLAATEVQARPRMESERVLDKRIRIGIVGGGFGTAFQWHLHPDCQVVAFCDLREDRLQRLAEVYGPAKSYRSFKDFLKHPQLDAVAVFTPAPLHVWMASEAMKVGKHVISAVPAGMSIEELEQLLECVKTTGMKYMMAETSYYHGEIIACRELQKENRFGTIFYSEAEYHHEGLISLMTDERGFPTWRHGFPPMHYPTHCTGMVVPVIGERMTEVQAMGWGDGHEILRTNTYANPFWNTTAFFKTSKGHACRISVFWHVAAGGIERAQFYGDRASYVMARPEKSPNTFMQISKDGKTTIDDNGYPEGKVSIEAHALPTYFDRLPEPMRVRTGHGNSHTFLTHEFIRSIIEDRSPAVDVYEAIAYTLPGIIAHQSALRQGEVLKIRDYGQALSS